MMNTDTKWKTKIDELTTFLNDCNKSYYQHHVSKISDQDFDKFLKELEALEKQYPQFKRPDSPTNHVGNDQSRGFQTVKHNKPMLSLENTYNENDVIKFVTGILETYKEADFVTEYKIDGLSISCIYEQGKLVRAVTRGNGIEGDDVTRNIKYVHNVPMQFPPWASRYLDVSKENFELRGEVFMSFEDFKETNKIRAAKGLPPLANPRNAASGTLKSLDPSVFEERKLYALFYQVEGIPFETHMGMYRWMDEFEIAHAPYYYCDNIVQNGITHVLQPILEAISKIDRLRSVASFPTDGAVIKTNQYSIREKLGYTSKYPRWAVAYKFNPEQAKTKIKDITVQVGRTGVLTPVAELEPTQLAGSLIKRATLHNDDMIRLHDFRIGDTVIIEKAGEVIPQVVRVVRHARNSQKFYLYEHVHGKCPCCGNMIVRAEGMTAWRCVNETCPARIRAQLEYISGKNALDINCMGSVVSHDLVDQGKVKNISDLFNLKQKDLSYLGVNGNKIYNSIQDAKTKDLADWITALGIQGVGPTIAKDIASMYHDLSDFYENYEVKNPDSIVENNIKEYLRNDTIIADLLEHGINPVSQTSGIKTLSGKTFVITGKLSSPRHEIEKRILALGGSVSSSVSSNTTYLVQGADDRVSSKAKKAKELNISVIDENQLMSILNQ